MPKHLFRKIMPSMEQLRANKTLGCLGDWLYDPNLWHLNRRSAAGAFAVGLFMAWVPVPFQLLAALTALLIHVNLPLSVALVWITNPLTIPPMFYFAYWLGTAIMGQPPAGFEFELSYEWLKDRLTQIWQPLMLGCAILAVLSSVIGYVGVRVFWRIHVTRTRRTKLATRRHRLLRRRSKT